MAKGKDVIELLKAYKAKDDAKFEKVVNKIIIDEKENNHLNIANKMEMIMSDYKPNVNYPYHHSLNYIEKVPKNVEQEAHLVDVYYPQTFKNEIVISDENLKILDDILYENLNEYKLRSHNLKPKQKILFCGPPGCGKTISANMIATELGWPLVYIKLDAIVSSYLGDTASNLRKVFEYISKGRYVVLFDEFDAIGKSRNDDNEHGELKRVVNSFLQMMDRMDNSSIIIAATNHQQLLDKAIWRRFDEMVYFDKPDKEDIKKLIKVKTRVFKEKDLNYEALAKKMTGMSHSEIELISREAIKTCIKRDIKILNDSMFDLAIQNQRRRMEIYSKQG